MDKTISAQIIILGGGLVGLTMANLCAQNGFNVALIESKEPNFSKKYDDENFDIRCSAITLSSEKIFRRIGIWDDLVDQRVSPYQKMIVWDGAGFGEICFDAKEIDSCHLGHIIENGVMLKALWDKAKSNKLIQFFCPYKPVDLSDLKAELIIGADGSKSWLREQGNISVTRSDYHQQALVATVKHELPHQQIAWQRFMPDGPVAFLPAAEPNTSSVVWTSSPEKTASHIKLGEIEFCKALGHAFDYRLGKVEKVYERLSFPLSKQHAQVYTKNRITLIGDAAHVIHPLAGQGLNLGILDTEALSETLIYGRENQCDLGHPQLLKRYERARKSHNLQMSAAMDFFKNIYSLENGLCLGLRGIGLNLVNNSQYLKKKIYQFAL